MANSKGTTNKNFCYHNSPLMHNCSPSTASMPLGTQMVSALDSANKNKDATSEMI